MTTALSYDHPRARPRAARPNPRPEADLEALFCCAYREHRGFVERRMRSLGLPPAHAEDATQDVFIIAWRRRADYDPRRAMGPWLAGIATRVAKDLRQRRWVRREVSEARADATDASPDAESRLAAHELLEECLAGVPFERRQVLLLQAEGVSLPDVARELNLNLNTAYSRLRLARAGLAKGQRRAASAGVMGS